MRIAGLLWGLLLAIVGAVVCASLSTPYTTLRKNGASYIPALTAGLGAVAHSIFAFVSSPWFLIPAGAVALVAVTVAITRRSMRPKKPDPYVRLGVRMHHFVNVAHHDQQFRNLSSVYKDTMRICREFQAFMVEVHQIGLPVPSPQTTYADEYIDICCEYFTAVGPFLRNDNFPYAMSVAQSFAERYPARTLS